MENVYLKHTSITLGGIFKGSWGLFQGLLVGPWSGGMARGRIGLGFALMRLQSEAPNLVFHESKRAFEFWVKGNMSGTCSDLTL